MKQEQIKELKEKRVQLFSRLKLRNIFPGEWESIYKGDGIEFAETRPFESGDNPRDLDFLTIAQSGDEFIVERAETRQLRVYVFADYSGSLQYFEQTLFPQKAWIRDIAVGLILGSAAKIYSPISFFPFGLTEKKFFPPKIGEGYCREIFDWISDEKNLHPYTSSGVESVLIDLRQLVQSRNIVFFISDFKQKFFDGDFTVPLERIVSKFDFIPVIIQDPLEKNVKLDLSTRIKVRSSSKKGKTEEIFLTPDVLRKIQEVSQKHLLNLEGNFRKLNVEQLVLNSSSVDDCCQVFSNFFQARKRTNRFGGRP